MKAPDKIYIHRTIHLGLLSAYEIVITGQDEQYIRKDTLLEWAKEKYKYYESLYSVTDDPVNWGQSNMCQQLIDKLNSM